MSVDWEESDNSAIDFYTVTNAYTINQADTGGGGSGDEGIVPGDADANFTSVAQADESRWQGQTLYFQNSSAANATYSLAPYDTDAPDNYSLSDSKDIVLNSEGEALIDTGSREGRWVIVSNESQVLTVDSNGNPTGTHDDSAGSGEAVLLRSQDFSADVTNDDDQVPRGDDIEVEFDGNRANYQVTVSSDGLSDSQLNDTFDDADTSADGIQVDVGDSTSTVTGTVPDDTDIGSYTLDFDVTDTEASDSADFNVTSATAESADFSEAAYSEERGDTATFTVEFQGGVSEGTVQVGGADQGYNVTMDVSDGDDDDDSVTVQWDTFEAGKDSNEGTAFSVADSEDSISSVQRFSEDVPDRVDAGEYDLSVEVGDEEADVAVLSISERSTNDAATWIAPSGDVDGFDNTTDLADSATQRSNVADGDLAVAQIDASGVFAYVDEADDLAGDGTNGVSVTVQQAERPRNQERKTLDLTSDAVQLYTDTSDDNLYLVVDTDATASQGNQQVEVEDGETYEAVFEVNGDDNPYVESDETESVNTTFTVEERTVEWNTNADDQVQVQAAAAQEIGGTTNIAPGTELTIRARTTGDAAFLKSNSSEVHDHENETGSFHANFDFQNVSQNTTFTVTIPNQDIVEPEDNAEVEGVVGPAPTASVSISDQESDGSEVVVDSVEMSEGGFVTIHDGTLLEGATLESVRGTSDYLEAGSHSDVTVSLDAPYEESGTAIAMPHQDTNSNEAYDFVDSEGAEDGPYTTDAGDAVVDDATVTIATETPTSTPEPDTDTPEPDTDTPEPDTDTPTPEPDQPGFGLVVALVALLGAALLAARRQA
jgi:PGF-CTERM protein